MSKIRAGLEEYLAVLIAEDMLELAVSDPGEFTFWVKSLIREDLEVYPTKDLLEEIESVSGGTFSISTDLIPAMKQMVAEAPTPHSIVLGD